VNILRFYSGILTLYLCAGTASARVSENFRYEDYVTTIAPREFVLAKLTAVTPIRENGSPFIGQTRWDIHWTYHWHRDGTGNCRITDVDVMLTTVMLLPRIVGADSAQRADFERILLDLRSHEFGHYDIAKRAAKKVNDYVQGLPTMSNCDQLKRAVDVGGSSILEEAKRIGVQYDAVTEHGKKQELWRTYY
jgi:predicted secreted Zn-dependent protease